MTRDSDLLWLVDHGFECDGNGGFRNEDGTTARQVVGVWHICEQGVESTGPTLAIAWDARGVIPDFDLTAAGFSLNDGRWRQGEVSVWRVGETFHARALHYECLSGTLGAALRALDADLMECVKSYRNGLTQIEEARTAIWAAGFNV